jgi:hypothetical protein
VNITQLRDRINKISERVDNPDRITVIYRPIIEAKSMKVITVMKCVIGERRFVEITEAEYQSECNGLRCH